MPTKKVKDIILDALEKYWNKSKDKLIQKDDIVDNLTSTSEKDPLSANQGRALKAEIDELNGKIPTKYAGSESLGGSAVDSDKLDGYHGSINQAANTYVCRDVHGYTYHNYINSNTSNSENPATVSQVIVTNGDNFFRKASLQHLKNALGLGTYTLGKSVPENAVFTDTNTTYSNFVKSGSTAAAGLVPKPPTTAGTTKYLREDGTWQTPPNTDTNTWRGIQDNCSSTSTTDSLSANQGRILKEMINTRVNTGSVSGTFDAISNFMKYHGSNNANITAAGTNYFISLSTSDERIKENIQDSEIHALDDICKIRHHAFDFKYSEFGGHSDIGYIAQELRKIIPDAVIAVPQDPEKYGFDEMYQIDYYKIIPYLTRAIQELSEKLDGLVKEKA